MGHDVPFITRGRKDVPSIPWSTIKTTGVRSLTANARRNNVFLSQKSNRNSWTSLSQHWKKKEQNEHSQNPIKKEREKTKKINVTKSSHYKIQKLTKRKF
jgi:hypothetical protein